MEFAVSDALKLGEQQGGAPVPGGLAKMTALGQHERCD